ncbi:SWI/SNF-related matrix-associated actin-dependent regulator of chromatin subfamily E member 1 isoform X12 [Rhipicephalus sanguineus]|uniref:SWI/SNF-related matrix-associated actin-dependent regulator of chromatin subfamily E member 1 isoform X12 n=1 Tax=Rhipicephalus sanguineus TaxID=34632 RepID=UPI0020C1F10B|nr:SWI/SNF-related matrix-associated actin-dependent regulator of chromatin subfamily E member 1 isoform X12 [Rhipicephalus sanguineus]
MALPPNYRQAQIAAATPPAPQRPRAQGTTSNSSSPMPSSANSSPFVPSPHGHPSFNPLKLGSRGVGGAESRVPKPPKPPDKPLMPYMRYSRKMEYNEALKSYHSSPAYQAWVAAKVRAQQAAEEREALERSPSVVSSSLMSSQKSDGKVSIQPAEDEDDIDEFSVKHIAASRYMRNHRLINEIFSDAVVPDVRSVVTTARMSVLKRQVQSLTMHQEKLEAELQQIEEKFEAKKRKFLDASELFQADLKKRCGKTVDTETYQKMVERALEQLKKDNAAKEEQRGNGDSKPKEGEEGTDGGAAGSPEDEGGVAKEGSSLPEPMDTSSSPPCAPTGGQQQTEASAVPKEEEDNDDEERGSGSHSGPPPATNQESPTEDTQQQASSGATTAPSQQQQQQQQPPATPMECEDTAESQDSQERSDGAFSDQESKDASGRAPEVSTRPSEIPRIAMESLNQATQEMSGPQ